MLPLQCRWQCLPPSPPLSRPLVLLLVRCPGHRVHHVRSSVALGGTMRMHTCMHTNACVPLRVCVCVRVRVHAVRVRTTLRACVLCGGGCGLVRGVDIVKGGGAENTALETRGSTPSKQRTCICMEQRIEKCCQGMAEVLCS